MPKLVTATMTKSLRTGKVFLDWSQNSSAKTTIAPYSMRGREHPTVAAPRTWDELDDPDLRHLRFDEVLRTRRARRRPDRRARRECAAARQAHDLPPHARRRQDPRAGARRPHRPSGNDDTFVIQEHHARRLHYDFRLERDGVLVSWAVPKNLPETTSVNHLAVHTEDHPLEYATFEGEIPHGEYGGGNVIVWDSGTYETEKFRDNAPDGPAKGGEVIVTLHGAKISGRYALIQTDGKNWLAHRMKEQPTLLADGHGADAGHPRVGGQADVDGLGVRGQVGRLPTARRRRPRRSSNCARAADATSPASIRNSQALAADLAEHHVMLDGEVVALDESGVPSFEEMQNRARSTRVEFWAFDILSLDGRSLLRAKYSDRRTHARSTGRGRRSDRSRSCCPATAPEALEYAREHRWEGVVAKKWDSTYQPGRRSQSWIKDKLWHTQEVVIGGWRAGEGGRTSGIGALLVGVPDDGGLHFVGRVGTGFTEKELAQAQEDPGAAAHRRITLHQKAFRTRCQGCDVRADRSWWGRCATAKDLRWPAAAAQLARAAPGQDARVVRE